MNKIIPFVLLIVLFPVIAGCQQSSEISETRDQKKDLINNQFPEAQAEIKEVLDGIYQSFIDKDADRLISYHVYGPQLEMK